MMILSDQVYTQEQVDQMLAEAKRAWIEKELNPVIAERDELLKFKPVEPSEEQKQIQQLKAELLQTKVVAALKEAQLEDFADFLNVSDEQELQSKIEKLSKIVEQRKLNNSYIPQDHKQTDAYSYAKSKGDTLGMIKAIFSK